MQHYIDALGGSEAIKNLKTRKAEAKATEPSFDPKHPEHRKYQFQWKAPDKVLVKNRLVVAGAPFLKFPTATFIFDGNWWGDGHGHTYPHENTVVFAMNRVLADPLMVARPEQWYSKFETADDNVNSSGICVLRAYGRDGRIDRLHFDLLTGLLKIWQWQLLRPRESFFITFRFDDYRQAGPVKFPFYAQVGVYAQVGDADFFRYTKVVHNEAISDAEFTLK